MDEEQQKPRGLMSSARMRAQPQQQAPEQNVDEDDTITGGMGEEPTPQEQADYETAMYAAAEIMFSEESYPKIVQMLGDLSDDAVEALSQVAVLIMSQLDEQTEGGLPEEMQLVPLGEIVEQLAEIASKEQLFEVNDRTMNLAAQQAVASWGEQLGYDEEELVAAMQQLPSDAGQAVTEYTQRYGAEQEGANG